MPSFHNLKDSQKFSTLTSRLLAKNNNDMIPDSIDSVSDKVLARTGVGVFPIEERDKRLLGVEE